MAVFPDDLEPDESGLVALGGRLSPQILVEAYSKGIFPWTGAHPIPWFSPDPRMVLFPGEIHVSRSLKKTINRGHLEIRFDTMFRQVMKRCKKALRPGQDGTWITQNMLEEYGKLHDAGVAHSVEAFLNGKLVGGLYGLSIGRAFFGESMFAEVPDASKVALVHLARRLQVRGYAFIDCQQETAHLRRMGARPISRREFLAKLRPAVSQPDAWGETPVASAG